MKCYRTFSSAETKKFAKAFSKKVLRGEPRTNALVIGLRGPLGSGKTTFIQGFFRGVGIKKRALSPTFILMRRVKLKKRMFKHLFHIDAYRLRGPQGLLKLGLREILLSPEHIVLIEWADKIKKVLPKSTVWLNFKHGRKENERTIRASVPIYE